MPKPVYKTNNLKNVILPNIELLKKLDKDIQFNFNQNQEIDFKFDFEQIIEFVLI